MADRNIFYFKPVDRVAELYYEFWQKNGRNARLFPFIHRKADHFLGRYVLPRDFHSHLQPFQFVEEGHRTVHVGFHDQYIDMGISHPLILAGLVGESGTVCAIDPDKTNTEAMLHYVKRHGIRNLSVIYGGVWEEKGTVEFVMFDDYTSSNTVAGVFDSFRDGAERRWGKKRIEQQSRVETIEVDTLDNTVAANAKGDMRVDFLNLTVNGAEPRILAGAVRVLEANPGIRVCFPFSHLSSEMQNMLESMGFLIAVADSPHRPWETEQFLYACALRADPGHLTASGFRRATVETITAHKEDAVGRFRIKEM